MIIMKKLIMNKIRMIILSVLNILYFKIDISNNI